MALRPRFTEQLPMQITPEMRKNLETIHATDPDAPSLSAAGRILLDLGWLAYQEKIGAAQLAQWANGSR